MKPSDIEIGYRFSRLAVVGLAGKDKKSRKLFFVSCDCGHEAFVVYGSNLISGDTGSCGCKQREAVRRTRMTHGMAGSREYVAWAQMIQRCTNPKAKKYENYGGRGISVCDRWIKFENFYADMPPRPSTLHSMDRINNNGNYEPGNVRWATAKEQASNRRPRSRRTTQAASPTVT